MNSNRVNYSNGVIVGMIFLKSLSFNLKNSTQTYLILYSYPMNQDPINWIELSNILIDS